MATKLIEKLLNNDLNCSYQFYIIFPSHSSRKFGVCIFLASSFFQFQTPYPNHQCSLLNRPIEAKTSSNQTSILSFGQQVQAVS